MKKRPYFSKPPAGFRAPRVTVRGVTQAEAERLMAEMADISEALTDAGESPLKVVYVRKLPDPEGKR
jgi:hypothetical protein